MKIDLILSSVIFENEQLFNWDGVVHATRPDATDWRGLPLHVVARMPDRFVKDRDFALLPENKTPVELVKRHSEIYRAQFKKGGPV